jgi:hypothetical protein
LRSAPASRTICWNRGVEPSSTSRSGGTSPRCCGATAPRWPWNSGPSTSQSLIGAHTWRGPSPKPWQCGKDAANTLAGKIARRPVTCEDLGAWMVSEGLALAYRRYSHDYVDEEAEARAARRGVWAGEFVKPREWRRANPARKYGRWEFCREL